MKAIIEWNSFHDRRHSSPTERYGILHQRHKLFCACLLCTVQARVPTRTQSLWKFGKQRTSYQQTIFTKMRFCSIATFVLLLAPSSDAFLPPFRSLISSGTTADASFWRLDYVDHQAEPQPLFPNPGLNVPQSASQFMVKETEWTRMEDSRGKKTGETSRSELS